MSLAELGAWLWKNWPEAKRRGAVGRDAYWPGIIRLASKPDVARRELGEEALTPRVFPLWYLKTYYSGRAWISISYVGSGGRPLVVDYTFIDLDIDKPKEECLRLREEEPEKFKALLGQVREEAVHIARLMIRKLDATPILTYTGCRGFQILLPIKPVAPEKYYEVVVALVGVLGLSKRFFDRKVVEPRRFFRFPFTYHEKTGEMCVPLDPSTGEPMEREEAIRYFSSIEHIDILEIVQDGIALHKLARLAEEEEQKRAQTKARRSPRARRKGGRGGRKCSTIEEAIEIAPPCIKRIHDRLMQGVNLEHTERVAYVIYLKKRGLPWEVVADFLLKHLPDANERICRYQVRHLYGLEGGRIDYSMPSCRKMREWGLCPGPCGRRHPLDITT